MTAFDVEEEVGTPFATVLGTFLEPCCSCCLVVALSAVTAAVTEAVTVFAEREKADEAEADDDANIDWLL